MKFRRAKIFMLSALAMFLAPVVAGFADDRADRDDQQRQQRYELMDQEKQLLKEDDELSQQVFELKRTMNEIYKRLSASEASLATVRHRLISIRMQMMP